jgi:hypothetical protein
MGRSQALIRTIVTPSQRQAIDRGTTPGLTSVGYTDRCREVCEGVHALKFRRENVLHGLFHAVRPIPVNPSTLPTRSAQRPCFVAGCSLFSVSLQACRKEHQLGPHGL